MLPSERIIQFEVDFRAVEGTIAVVHFVLLAEIVQCAFELRLGQIPVLHSA